MKIAERKSIERRGRVWRTATVIAAVAFTGPVDLAPALADDVAGKTAVKTEDAPPAEDPAEVQRRQQIKQQATHWEQQLTKLLYGDLELIRSGSGDIPRDARRAISRAGEQAVKEAAVRLAELQFGGPRRRLEVGNGGIVIVGKGTVIIDGNKIVAGPVAAAGRQGNEGNSGDPAELVSSALARSLAEHVGSEQATAYAGQVRERSDRRRAAAAHEIVAVLDGELFLTATQREQIERSLLEKWDDAMVVSLEGMHWADDRRVFPGLPADCVSPHLTETQRKRFAPQGNVGGAAAQRQTWVRMNVLNNVQAAARDPWWFD